MVYTLLVLFYFGLPVLIILFTLRNKGAEKIGAVIISYVIGLIVGNIGLIPPKYLEFQNFLLQFSVAIAVPLLLFSSNLKLWSKLIGKTFLSMLLGLVSVVLVVYVGYFIFKGKIENIWQISGLLVGLYSGGDPNLASLKTALDVNQNTFIVVHVSDLAFGVFFLLFILSIGQKTFELFLPKFSLSKKMNLDKFDKDLSGFHDFKGFFRKSNIKDLVIALLLSIVIVGIAFWGGSISIKYSSVLTILFITSLALGASFIKKIRDLKKSFQLGIYFILVFSLIVSSMADFTQIFKFSSLYILLYVIFSVMGSIIIHTLLSKIFKVDADTMIITSIALVYSVPFIPVVAGALKNKYIIISGIIIGLIGYAIGNYLGIFVAYSLK